MSKVYTPTTEAAVSKSFHTAPSHSNAEQTRPLVSINTSQNSNTNSLRSEPPEIVKDNASPLVNKPTILQKQQVWLPVQLLQSGTSHVLRLPSPQTAITAENSTISTPTTNSITMRPVSLSRAKPVAVTMVSSALGVSRSAWPQTTINLQNSTITSPATKAIIMHPAASSGPVPVVKQNPTLVNLRNLPGGQVAQNPQIIRLPAQPNIQRPTNYGRTPVPLVSAGDSGVRLNSQTGQCRLVRAFRVNRYPPAGITNSNDPTNKKLIHLLTLKTTPLPQPYMRLIQLPGNKVRPASLPTNPNAVTPKLGLNHK